MLAALMLVVGLQAAAPAGTVVRGRVTLEGERPRERALKIAPKPGCEAIPLPKTREDVVVDVAGGLRWAVVRVTRGLGGKRFEVPKEAGRLEVKGHRFEPRVLGVRVGQELCFVNMDEHPYQVHGLPFKNREFSVSLPKRGMEASHRMEHEEIFKIQDS